MKTTPAQTDGESLPDDAMGEQVDEETRGQAIVMQVPLLALSRKQAAVALGISTRKLDELRNDRDAGLPCVYIGSRVVLPTDQLRQWINRRWSGAEK